MAEAPIHLHAVRRLYKPDLPLLRDHLLRLDAETRYRRFGLQVSDAYLEQYAELCFGRRAIVYGYVEDGLVRGLAELRFDAAAGTAHPEAEAALSVETAWRRRGIGTDLMAHIVLAARNRSIKTLAIFCLRHNAAMLHLARKFDAELQFTTTDVTGHLVSARPSMWSLWRETMADAFDYTASLLDYQMRSGPKVTPLS